VDNKSAVAVLSALAFETRLEAVQLLALIGEEGLAAGELARRLGVQQNTLSDHLQALARAGIVTQERQGRSIIYRADPQPLNELITVLRDSCTAHRKRM
jgi:DNA-binding transcriptional ArsR family regulator